MNNKDYIFVRRKENDGIEKIILNDIIYIKANGDYVQIFTYKKRHVIHQTLKQMQKILPENIFYRCHRSFMINVDKIEYIIDNCAHINEKLFVLIGEEYKKQLISMINYISTISEIKKQN